MWKCSQCETLNGDDSPICIICGIGREEVLAEQKQPERTAAASAPAKPVEVTMNWPKEDAPREETPREPTRKRLWEELSEGLDEGRREQLRMVGRVLAFAALLVQITLHMTHETPMLDTVFMRWYGSAVFLESLFALAAPATALLIPFLLGRKRRTEALLAALVFTFVHVVAAISLYNRFQGSGFLSQAPSLLLAIVLLSCAKQGEIEDWMVPTMRVVTIVSAAAFVIFTFITVSGSFTIQAWQNDWHNIFVYKAWRRGHPKYFVLSYLYPIHRAFLALAVTLLFRANREK